MRVAGRRGNLPLKPPCSTLYSASELKHAWGLIVSNKESAELDQDNLNGESPGQEQAQQPEQEVNGDVAADEQGAAGAGETEPSRDEELAAAKDQVLRVQAEMQNLRRRVERDMENAHKYALEKFVGQLLPVVDNLERAIAAIPADNQENQVILEGVELTLKSFTDVLGKFEVKVVDPKGEAFNPELHQAMTMMPSPEHRPNTVIDVFQKGYTLNGRLVRPAMVVVAKGE